MAGQGGLPRWLSRLMEETFFVDCRTHGFKKNIFCLFCCISVCKICVEDHQSHRRIQIKRRDDCATVKFEDLREFINCSLIRTYAVHGEEVIFLRPQTRFSISMHKKNICSFCANALIGKYPYCSLTCKVEHVRWEENDISSILVQFDASQTNVYDKSGDEVLDGDHKQITPDLAPIDFVRGEGSSSGWSIRDVESSKKKRRENALS